MVDRPKFSEVKLDAKGMLLLPKAVAAAKKGDDALLRFIVGICEDEGLTAISVARAAPALVADEGVLGKIVPDAEHRADIERAFKIVHALGAVDVGQAAVVCDGLPLAVEAAEGTDAVLLRIPLLRESLRGTAEKKRGVLAKALKPTQDAKTDMPVVGVQTVKNAAAAFLAGIAVEAGGPPVPRPQAGGGGGGPAVAVVGAGGARKERRAHAPAGRRCQKTRDRTHCR